MTDIYKAAQQALAAWDETVLPKANDGMMQERMESLRYALEQKDEKRPQNCGTGYCSCIECPYEQPADHIPDAGKMVPPFNHKSRPPDTLGNPGTSNMNKHYEFVAGDEIVTSSGYTLKRIRATTNIPALRVSIGDVGGYIEKPENLSGNAWVSGNAQVYGDAQVFGNAKVSDNVQVFGNARVSGDTLVYANAWLYGNAWVYGNAKVCGNACVYGNTQVYDNAQVQADAQVVGNSLVFGDALVYGDALVSGNAQVCGNARVSGSADWLLIGPAKSSGRFTTAHKDEKLGVQVNSGCFSGSVLEFSKQIEETHKCNQTDLEQYRLFYQLIVSNFGVQE